VALGAPAPELNDVDEDVGLAVAYQIPQQQSDVLARWFVSLGMYDDTCQDVLARTAMLRSPV
jgi:hypothetical protein